MTAADFLVFVALWNRRQGMQTPHPHRIIAQFLAQQWESGQHHILLMAFRACGKSTLVALFAAWLLQQNPNLRIMVVAADMVLAEKMVRNIRRVIEKHPLTSMLKPKSAGQWTAMQFTVNRPATMRDPSVLARSVQTNITGSRADVIICDDVEVPGTAATPTARMDLRDRLRELDFVLTPGGSMIYVGTPHSYDSIYAATAASGSIEEKPFLQNFSRFELPLLNTAGESAWPERYPLSAIEALQKKTSKNKFASQMMLQPVSLADARLPPDLIKSYKDELCYEEGNQQSRLSLGGVQLIGASCWWDPAFSGARDSSVVALVFTDAENNYYFHRVLYLRVRAESADAEAQQQCDQVADFIAAHYVPGIKIESNGIGQFLPGLLRKTLQQRGMNASVQPVNSTRNKADRIVETLEVPLAAGVIHAHHSIWQSNFMTEMREWSPERPGAADDALDALAGAIGEMPLRIGGMASRSNHLSGRQNWTAQTVLNGEKPFKF
jgi:predicted phage terminase large subunit-like protein